MSTVVLSHALYDPGMRLLEQNGIDIVIPNNGNSDDILEDLQKADGFILRIGKIDRKAIEACSQLKVITRPGVGVDNVNVKAATEHGIPVVICPAANSRSVAEHTIALMFAASKNLIESDRETRKGNFGIRNKYAAVELKDKTLAVLGFGHIGQEVAAMAAALGMKVVAYDPFLDKQNVKSLGYGYTASLEDAVSSGDFVTLHMPSMPETKGMIDKSVFRQAKETAYFINCARGDIVNEQDLYDALASESIAGAAVDVLSSEPMEASSPLMQLDNFIVTPHMAGQTREATTTIVTMAVEGTLAVLRGGEWPHVCNPEVYDLQAWKDRQ